MKKLGITAKANGKLCTIVFILMSWFSYSPIYSQTNCTISGSGCKGSGNCSEQKTLYDAKGADTKHYAYCRKVQRDPTEGGDTCACAAIVKEGKRQVAK